MRGNFCCTSEIIVMYMKKACFRFVMKIVEPKLCCHVVKLHHHLPPIPTEASKASLNITLIYFSNTSKSTPNSLVHAGNSFWEPYSGDWTPLLLPSMQWGVGAGLGTFLHK